MTREFSVSDFSCGRDMLGLGFSRAMRETQWILRRSTLDRSPKGILDEKEAYSRSRFRAKICR